MKPASVIRPKDLTRRLSLTFAMVAVAFTANANDIHMDATPHGTIGVEVGPSMHAGRTHVVDGVSGATLQKTEDDWSRYAATVGAAVDLGFPTSPRGLQGTVGMHLSVGGSAPGPFYEINTLARYRFRFVLPDGIHTIEPWVGAGIGLHFIDRITSDAHIQLPLSAGCDFQLGVPHLLLTTRFQINTLNPFGPVHRDVDDGAERILKPRYDSYMLKVGIAFAFY